MDSQLSEEYCRAPKRSRPSHEAIRDAVKRHRSRSPRRKHTKHSKHQQNHHLAEVSQPIRLPFHQLHLAKRDLEAYHALFAEYLDVQKQLDIDSLSEHEVKGRWRSFLGKWNRNELAEGWYDPEMKERATERRKSQPPSTVDTRPIESQRLAQGSDRNQYGDTDEDEDEDEAQDEQGDPYGPSLPASSASTTLGPTIPNLGDLQHRRELAEEEDTARRKALRYERKQERSAQQERQDELAPRAEAGTRERQLEKRRAAATANRDYRDAKASGGDVDVGENELMGDDGIDGYKAQKKAQEKRKTEREVRKEEVLRARAAERAEKVAEHRRKEDKTMEMLRAIARERFG